MGPPLGIRSISATCDGRVLLANVHVGGIPRSLDGGASWRPTLDIDLDVHEVSAHPSRPELVAAASAQGLCISRDGPLDRVGGGLPAWLAGIADTYCISARGDHLVIVDRSGALYGSQNQGSSWSLWEQGLPSPSGVLIC